MSGPTLEFFESIDPDESLVVVAFHTTGAAGPICAHYLIEELDVPLVGHVTAEWLQGIVHVQDGHATSPIRIFGGEVACEIGKPCKQLVIFSAEVPLPPEPLHELTEAIVAWAKSAGLVLALDAVARGQGDDKPDVWAVAHSREALAALEPTQSQPLAAGLLSGLGAHLINAGRAHNVPTGALVVEALRGQPDGRAAAALVRSLDKLIPQIVVDAGPLEEQAAELEAQIAKALDELEQAPEPKRIPHTFI